MSSLIIKLLVDFWLSQMIFLTLEITISSSVDFIFIHFAMIGYFGRYMQMGDGGRGGISYGILRRVEPTAISPPECWVPAAEIVRVKMRLVLLDIEISV